MGFTHPIESIAICGRLFDRLLGMALSRLVLFYRGLPVLTFGVRMRGKEDGMIRLL